MYMPSPCFDLFKHTVDLRLRKEACYRLAATQIPSPYTDSTLKGQNNYNGENSCITSAVCPTGAFQGLKKIHDDIIRVISV